MSDGNQTPEPATVQTPPTPVSAGPAPTKSKAKPRAKAAAGEKLAGVEAMLWSIALSAEQIDWTKHYVAGGYKNAKSAGDSFRVAKKRYLESLGDGAGADDDAAVDDDNGAPVKAKKRKPAKSADQEAKPKKVRKTKVKETEDEEQE